jgi:NADH-quinone oxidoreductase subunit D
MYSSDKLYIRVEACNKLYQLLDKMPESGEVRAKLQPNPKGRPGESYKRVESGRGALDYYIVSDGSPKPYMVKTSIGSFRNLLALPHLLVGSKVGDMKVAWFKDPDGNILNIVNRQ